MICHSACKKQREVKRRERKRTEENRREEKRREEQNRIKREMKSRDESRDERRERREKREERRERISRGRAAETHTFFAALVCSDSAAVSKSVREKDVLFRQPSAQQSRLRLLEIWACSCTEATCSVLAQDEAIGPRIVERPPSATLALKLVSVAQTWIGRHTDWNRLFRRQLW